MIRVQAEYWDFRLNLDFCALKNKKKFDNVFEM